MADSFRRYVRTQVVRALHDEFVISTHLQLFIWISVADTPPLAPHLCADKLSTSHAWLITNHSIVSRPCLFCAFTLQSLCTSEQKWKIKIGRY